MSTKAIGIAVGILIVAVVGWFMFKEDKVETTEEQLESAENLESEEGQKKMAFVDFIKQGGSYECTVDMHMDGMEAQGTTYISGDMMRAEYTMTVQGQTVESNMLMKDGYTYSWSSAAPNMGVKMKNMAATGPGSAEFSANYSFDANAVGDYDCHSWTPSSSTFAIPSAVTFTELKVN